MIIVRLYTWFYFFFYTKCFGELVSDEKVQLVISTLYSEIKATKEKILYLENRIIENEEINKMFFESQGFINLLTNYYSQFIFFVNKDKKKAKKTIKLIKEILVKKTNEIQKIDPKMFEMLEEIILAICFYLFEQNETKLLRDIKKTYSSMCKIIGIESVIYKKVKLMSYCLKTNFGGAKLQQMIFSIRNMDLEEDLIMTCIQSKILQAD